MQRRCRCYLLIAALVLPLAGSFCPGAQPYMRPTSCRLLGGFAGQWAVPMDQTQERVGLGWTLAMQGNYGIDDSGDELPGRNNGELGTT